MMADIWFISDTHFNHENIATKFTLEDGSPARPFSSVDEMNEVMIQNWNKLVKEQDHVWHLGDVIMGNRHYISAVLSRLKGKKRMLLGNHDQLKGCELMKFFQKVELWRVFKEYDFVCTHIPLRRESFRAVNFNVHGHIHHAVIQDPAYINVCVEHTNYAPIHLDEIRAIIKQRRDHNGPV